MMADMDKRDDCCSTHLIDEDGNFNDAGIENFAKEVKLSECGISYAVVAIMGPRGSGKTTLLNHLFGTNFREMDALEGRSQTTKGIWLAQCVGIEPCTLVMDLEGTDGREKGEDDTAFEKQSALFALAVSDIVLINMWCHDIGREQAAHKPLLKTVFQVLMRLLSPRKTTLMFVIRDKTKTPVEKLEPVLRDDIQKIWNSVPKPQARTETPLSDFFNIEVVALSSYEVMKEQFKEQAVSLRQRFFHSIAPGGLAGDRWGVVPASGFSFSAQQIWKVIRENKDLDLQAHKVMVATVRCEEIANEKFSSFTVSEEWRQLEETVDSQPVPEFGRKLTTILDVCLSQYDAEAMYFDEDVRSSKRKQLEEKLLQLVQPAYQSMLGHISSRMLDGFKEAFDKALNEGKGFAVAARDCTEYYKSQCDVAAADVHIGQANWDSSEVREKLKHDIDAHIAAVRVAKLSELTNMYETKSNEALVEPVEALLDAAGDDTWSAIRKLLHHETETAVSGFSSALSGFEIDDVTKDKMLSSLEDYARGVVEAKAKEKAESVLNRMKDRFSMLLGHDSDSNPHVWTEKEDIEAIIKAARSASLKLLSVTAAARLDDTVDNIENTLSLALIDPESRGAASGSISGDPLASSSWEEVPPSKTFLTPVQCKSLWLQFIAETEDILRQARDAYEEAKVPPSKTLLMPVQCKSLWLQFIVETEDIVREARDAYEKSKIKTLLMPIECKSLWLQFIAETEDIVKQARDAYEIAKIPPSKTLLTPVQCKALWLQFIAETENIVKQAIDAHEKAKEASKPTPPPPRPPPPSPPPPRRRGLFGTIVGAVTGVVVGAVTAIVTENPVAGVAAGIAAGGAVTELLSEDH